MNSVAKYIVPEISIDAREYGISDAFSLVATKAQAATAGTMYVQSSTTDSAVPSAYGTQFRFRDRPPNIRAAALDAQGGNLDLETIDAVSNVSPDFFLLGRTAPPVQQPRGNTSAVVAEWEGFVTRIDEEAIEARLVGLTGEGVAGEVEEATIPKSEIRDADQQLVAVGGLFRLCISYEKTPAGERRKYSSVVFRRLPAYRQRDLDAAHERTRARLNALRVE
jgi:hypothetical protein